MERKIKDKGFKLSETTGENYLMLFKDTPVKFLFYYYPYKIPIWKRNGTGYLGDKKQFYWSLCL